MEKLSVTKTRNLGLCLSCEICAAVCPKGAVTMEYKNGQFLPKVDDERCTECGLCLELCPGIDIDPSGLRYKSISDDIFDGPCLETYIAYSNEPEIRRGSTSGGLITNLIVELIKNEEFDAAFVLNFDNFDGKPARLKATAEIDEIVNAAKSKYVPASVYEVIRILKEGDGRRYIIVGTPCQIYGIKKFMKRYSISEEGLLFLGLFCDKTLNFNTIRYFADTYGKINERLVKFEFRTKEKYGWPGNSKLCFDSGREIIVDRTVRMQLKSLFQLKRCLFCLDKLNRLADISFGDCYIKWKCNPQGKSSVIVRTKKGKEVFDRYSYLFTLEGVSLEAIKRSQHLEDKLSNLEYAKIYIKEQNIYPDVVSSYESNRQAARKLSILNKYIGWGRNYNLSKIRCLALLSRMERKINIAKKAIMLGSWFGAVITKEFLSHRQSKKMDSSGESNSGNLIIVGGNFLNKGAQAMAFTAVDQLKRRFPNKNIYLFSGQDFDRDDGEKKLYTFEILPWDPSMKLELLGLERDVLRRGNYSKRIKNRVREVVRNADFFIDVSGYALSSQWGLLISANYLLNIIIARKFSIPYFIFPQSIGPFDYILAHKILLYPLMIFYLRYPEKMFIREEGGLKCVRKFSKKNVERGYDIVLQNREYDIANIFKKEYHFKDIKIKPNSVGIIPNSRVFEQVAPNELYSMYRSLISRLLGANKTVYILRHSYEDLGICEKMKSFFPNLASVKLISDELNAIELEGVIKQFDFVIASRYHSIIHSYRNGVPALVFGWAAKYFQLLRDFDQLDYYFDVRNDMDVAGIVSKLDQLMQRYSCERRKIISKMDSLAGTMPFDVLAK